jgi:hypothetical protein
MSIVQEQLVEAPGTHPGAERLGRFAGLLLVAGQLALVLAVVRLFDIAGRNHFFAVMCIAAGGFLIHAWLPARWRGPFFCLLSLGGILFVAGWPTGAWVIGIGAGLIALCHLPVPFALRVAALAVAGLGLALARMDYVDEPFWPLLGSLFMFRLIVYMHDLRRSADRAPSWLTAAYFFPLPNLSFLFFPILDFKTFRETHRADAPWTVAQDGIGWIVRGLTHLLLYRIVKYYLLPAPHELADVEHLALFLAANYALYLHVSGYFHVITGVFHLFGFQLPRTHHNYFLASSFTDIWRRINIYWKDFMTKVFFLPAFFALRGWGTRTAAVVAALGVFLATWLLHAYQVFWITGELRQLYLYDAALWLIVGVLVAWNLQRDLARAARPASGRPSASLASAVSLSLRVVGMFVLVSFFWACWNTPAFLSYLPAAPVRGPGAAAGFTRVLGVLFIVAAVGVVVQLARDRLTRIGLLPLRISPTGSALAHAAVLSALALAALPEVAGVFGHRAAQTVAELRHESATAAEAAQVVPGYYEEITEARVPAGSWLAAMEGRPRPPHHIYYTDMTQASDELLERELIPNWSGDIGGRRLTINRLGMRDRADRSQQKPPGTRRVAMVGSSVVMGYGIGDDETFTRLLEEWLNGRPRPDAPRYEVLNFGTGMSFVIQRRVLLDRKVFGFEPDAVYYVAHQDELEGPVRHLAKLVANGRDLPYPSLKDVVRKARIAPGESQGMTEALLRPLARDIVLGVYRDLVAECRRRGVLPVWIYIPIPGVVNAPAQSEEFVKLAKEAGFVVVDLSDWAEGYRPADVKLGQEDPHANALGHRLIAERLEAELRRRPDLLP